MLASIGAAVVLSACAGFGVFYSTDPAAKLHDANDLLYRQNRPLIAERLIREAVDIYQRNSDDLGLAEAYRTYAFFFRSETVEAAMNFYRAKGFLEPTAIFDTRYEKSIEYFDRAGEIFAQRNRFDALTNVAFNKGITYMRMGAFKRGCQAFDQSVENHRANTEQDPAAKPSAPAPFKSYPEFIADAKKRYGCAYL